MPTDVTERIIQTIYTVVIAQNTNFGFPNNVDLSYFESNKMKLSDVLQATVDPI